jgi:hypothetical protein
MARTIVYFLFIVFIITSCSAQRKSQSLSLNNTSASSKKIEPLSDQKTADGSSFEKAIFIDKTSEMAGVDGIRMGKRALSRLSDD